MSSSKPSLPPYTMDDLGGDAKRHAPAAERNVVFIGGVLERWLPETGVVLEVASGTGQHAVAFARRFPALRWMPSDPDPLALASIEAWTADDGPANLLEPVNLDAAATAWPVTSADVILNVNMVHIAPPEAGIGLLDGAARILPAGGRLIFYGPWLADDMETAPSNLAFDSSLKQRDPRWGLRRVEDYEAEAGARGLRLVDRAAMPANNLMLLFERG